MTREAALSSDMMGGRSVPSAKGKACTSQSEGITLRLVTRMLV
jgi:hypothetical protein